MFKVYLVDDERPIIEELLSIIDWKSLNCEICGYNTDSLTALDEILEIKPDILISDINMRGINGLELVSCVTKARKDLGVILLNAYDLFDYAAEAIKLRVLSYLIKPVNKKELCSVIKEYQKSRANEIFSDFFKMLDSQFSDEKIIKQTENEALRLGFIEKGHRYAFSFIAPDEELQNIVAEHSQNDYRFALLSLSGESGEWIETLQKKSFGGGESFFKYAKPAFEDKGRLNENEIKKEIKIAIDKILEDIAVNYSTKISLSYYASEYHYNPTYLSQQFKLYVGMNFIDYVIKVRLEKAKQFMRDKSLSMNEIAYKLGYDDYSHFSKIFKKHEGMSPADYRKNYC